MTKRNEQEKCFLAFDHRKNYEKLIYIQLPSRCYKSLIVFLLIQFYFIRLPSCHVESNTKVYTAAMISCVPG
uniref:Uncharacterized protein n=1 Tax=Rhizophora mucronata TaxID=61149 RepID=A0A2P2PF81_RHIMU